MHVLEAWRKKHQKGICVRSSSSLKTKMAREYEQKDLEEAFVVESSIETLDEVEVWVKSVGLLRDTNEPQYLGQMILQFQPSRLEPAC